jgi:hypothetical protein
VSGTLALGLTSIVLASCGDEEIPKGPDLVFCHCECVTRTPTGTDSSPGGCSTDPTCDPSCGDFTCTPSGGCVSMCDPGGAGEYTGIETSTEVTLRVCVDASNPSHVAGACAARCTDYSSGSAEECAAALLTELGLSDEISEVVPEGVLEEINPDAAESVAGIIWEECGTWLLDKLTGTCGHSTQGLEALTDLLLCIWSPLDPLNGGAPAAFRTCGVVGTEVAILDGCPQYTESEEGTPVDDAPQPNTESVNSASSAVTISGDLVDTKTVHPSGTASTGRIGPVVLMSQLRLTLPDTTVTIDGHDVDLDGGHLFLERPVAFALEAGDTFTFEAGRLRTILTGTLDGERASVGAVNTGPVTGHYNEQTGTFDLAGTFQLEQLAAVVTVALTFDFTNRSPIAYAGPDQLIECSLPTREAPFEVSALGSEDIDPGDSISRYVWTVGRRRVADGPTAAVASGTLGLGTRVATLTTFDTHGSMSRDTALITVVDTTPPVFPALPPLVNSLCDLGVDVAMVPEPLVTDGCSPAVEVSGAIVAVNGQPVSPMPIVSTGLQLPFGTYQVEWTATDQSNNVATAMQTLVVRGGFQASDSIDLGDRVMVGTEGGFATLVNAGTGDTTLGVDAISGSIATLGDVLLQNRALVAGDVEAGGEVTLRNAAAVLGTLTENATLDIPSGLDLSGVVFPPPGTTPVSVASGDTAALLPGAYAGVTVDNGGILDVGPGTYYLASLDLKNGSTLRLAQPVQIYVTHSVNHQGEIETASGSPDAFLLGFAGTQSVSLKAAFPGGVVIAPNATVAIGSAGSEAFRGQLFAKRITVQPDGIVTCAPAAGSTP